MMENNIPTLHQYFRQVVDKAPKCRHCEYPDLSDGDIEHYDHDGGHPVQGYKEKQWIYIVCPGCQYQWSLGKLRLPDLSTIFNLKMNKHHEIPNKTHGSGIS